MDKKFTEEDLKKDLLVNKYKYGFTTDFEYDKLKNGLSEEVIHEISNKKNEPEWLLNFRLDSYRKWTKMKEPNWAKLNYKSPDFQSISYYAAPKNKKYKSWDDIDDKMKETMSKLGISIEEQKRLTGVAVDFVIDSVSVATSFKDKLDELGIIFCSFSDAVQDHPELVKKYLGTVVPSTDNFYAALNSAVFSDGSFCYIPKGIKCPMELSTYFRINEAGTGQFERTLLIADEDSFVSYLEGCTAPQRDENQLHAAVVELITMDNAKINYSTVQNWYSGDENGKGGVYNFVTKRGLCKGNSSEISWTQVETGSAITWKYPSCILFGDNSQGKFYSIALTNNFQQADTGTKMIHIGKNTKSTIISKGISAGNSQNSYRGLVQISKNASNSRNYTQCDSLLLGSSCGAHTFPIVECSNSSSIVEHEATTSKIEDDKLFYCQQRGIDEEKSISLLVNGFTKEILNKLPMEFAVEAQKLLEISLENSVG